MVGVTAGETDLATSPQLALVRNSFHPTGHKGVGVGTWISCGSNWRQRQTQCIVANPTSSQHGCCCATALRQEQTFNLGCQHLTWSNRCECVAIRPWFLRSAVRTNVPPIGQIGRTSCHDQRQVPLCLGVANGATQYLNGMEDFEFPQMRALATPPLREPEEFDPGGGGRERVGNTVHPTECEEVQS